MLPHLAFRGDAAETFDEFFKDPLGEDSITNEKAGILPTVSIWEISHQGELNSLVRNVGHSSWKCHCVTSDWLVSGDGSTL